uniref:Alpha-tocopherol transfer protein n=1 Tax=Lygus hesperus TaxID=30085 RepID=A0A0A9Z8P0_LYGHE
MPFKYPQLSVEQEDDVLKDIGYSRQQLESDKLVMRAWMDEQPHFPESCKKESDAFLVNYLVGCKGSLETVKTKLDCYYSMRGHGDLFTNRDTLDYLKSAATFQYVAVMPKPSPEGYIVTMVGLWTDDVDKYIMNDAIKRIILVHEWGLRQGSGIIRGVVFLLDGKGFSATHTMQLTLSTIKSIVAWLTQACPMRPHRFIVINVEPLLESIANTVIMPLLPEKIKRRAIFTRDEDFKKYLDNIEFLPTCYGGKESDKVTLANDCIEALIAGMKDILPTLGESTDESKRPKIDGYTNNPHFGAFGSIKNLVTD